MLAAAGEQRMSVATSFALLAGLPAGAGGIKAGDRVTTAGGIRGIILSIKDDVIVIRVAPDNIKLEVAKSAIASVTQEGLSGS